MTLTVMAIGLSILMFIALLGFAALSFVFRLFSFGRFFL